MSIPREVKLIGSSMSAIACRSWTFDTLEELRKADLDSNPWFLSLGAGERFL